LTLKKPQLISKQVGDNLIPADPGVDHAIEARKQKGQKDSKQFVFPPAGQCRHVFQYGFKFPDHWWPEQNLDKGGFSSVISVLSNNPANRLAELVNENETPCV